MKKVLSDIKGFAMAELLAVSIVVLLIFSVLFANYLPLVVEYENRLSYNDVTAQYAAHYVRKMYKDALEDQTKGPGLKSILETGIGSTNKFLTVYKKGSVTSMCGHVLTKDQSKCNNIINEYGIEEVIVTNYKLTDVIYTKSNGKLTNYINYLPEYKNSIYTGANMDESKQLYRIILKTTDFGYATTPILSDYVVSADCFDLEYSSGKFTILGYKGITEECPQDVIIPSGRVADENGKRGIITKIGDNAFKNKAITSIGFGEEVISIGDSAFEGTRIKTVNLNQVTSIGKRAFANTLLEEIVLLPNRTYEDEVFVNNNNLSKVDLSQLNGDIKKKDGTLATSLFANSGSSGSGISVTIPNTMQNIGEKMFYQAKMSQIGFAENSSLKTIGVSAFEQNINNSVKLTSNIDIPASVEKIEKYSFRYLGMIGLSFAENASLSIIEDDAFAQKELNRVIMTGGNITIPASVETIGKRSFQYLGITDLSFTGNNLKTIGESAFEQDDYNTGAKAGDLTIPSSVTTLGANSFKNIGITSLTFGSGIGITSINANVFEYTGNRSADFTIPTVTIPTSVTEIGASAFRNRGIGVVNFHDNVTVIGNYAFTDNNIKSLNMPDSVIGAGEGAFSSNKELETIKLSNKLTIIQSDLFNDCSNSLTSGKVITIPDSVTQIRSRAFVNANVAEVKFSSNTKLKAIWNDAFSTNSSLENFTIPSTVTSIGSRAFAACVNLGKTEGSFVNNSSNLGSTNWCDVFYNVNEVSCDITTSGSTIVVAPIGLTGTKYVTAGGGN